VADTVVEAAPVLAGTGSGVEAEIVAVLAITVFTGVPAFTCTTIVKVWVEKAGTLARVQLTVPVPPTAGVEHVHPGAGVRAWKFVLAGMGSVRDADDAALGPLLRTVTV
jgi:hypothetical protein